ncbi:MAG: InlB B-repeat-containing protein [Lachnospiraceae bacterium]|nr:InlB B-repeat-containing protein [Lachnospiraceae bacterium]
MMRKIFGTILRILLLLLMFSGNIISVSAEESLGSVNTAGGVTHSGSPAPSFSFELSVDGKDIKEVEFGDIITVVLRLKRTDANEPYTMYAMQDEIRYDSTFFELMGDSAVLGNGIASTDIAMVDQYREFYMNYLSMNGGEEWNADTLIGSFQLKVVGESGVTKITNQDYLVSLQDGSDSYPCNANEVTIILSTDCVVTFRTNGGSELDDITVLFGEKIKRPNDPVREGFRFEGWFKDIHLTEEWNFENDTVQENMSLYAKWSAVEMEEDVLGTDITAETSDMNQVAGYWWWTLVLILLILVLIWFRKHKGEKNKE